MQKLANSACLGTKVIFTSQLFLTTALHQQVFSRKTYTTMILRRCPIGLSQSIAHDAGSSIRLGYMRGRRHASAAAAVAVDDAFDELDPSPSVMNDGPSEDVVQSFDPVGQSQKRGKELPASR